MCVRVLCSCGQDSCVDVCTCTVFMWDCVLMYVYCVHVARTRVLLCIVYCVHVTRTRVLLCIRVLYSCGTRVLVCVSVLYSCGTRVLVCVSVLYSCGTCVLVCVSVLYSCGTRVLMCVRVLYACIKTINLTGLRNRKTSKAKCPKPEMKRRQIRLLRTT